MKKSYVSVIVMSRTQVLRLQRRQTRSAQLSRMYNKSARKVECSLFAHQGRLHGAYAMLRY